MPTVTYSSGSSPPERYVSYISRYSHLDESISNAIGTTALSRASNLTVRCEYRHQIVAWYSIKTSKVIRYSKEMAASNLSLLLRRIKRRCRISWRSVMGQSIGHWRNNCSRRSSCNCAYRGHSEPWCYYNDNNNEWVNRSIHRLAPGFIMFSLFIHFMLLASTSEHRWQTLFCWSLTDFSLVASITTTTSTSELRSILTETLIFNKTTSSFCTRVFTVTRRRIILLSIRIQWWRDATVYCFWFESN